MAATQEQLDAVIAAWGPWSAHNIEIAPGLFTRPQLAGAPNPRLRQILQLVTDALGTTELSGIRVLDLGSLEGGFAIELALHGAEVVGIEGREGNTRRAQFAATSLGLDGLCQFEQDDVRSLSVERHGKFDIVLSLGILYHLDAESVFRQLESMYACTKRALILDTHVSLRDNFGHEYGGHVYRGHLFTEHGSTDSSELIASREWASLDNRQSFWPTRASLYDALTAIGFTSVLECHMPQSAITKADRVQLVAFKGERLDIRTVPSPPEPPTSYSAHSEIEPREALHAVVNDSSLLATAAAREVARRIRAARRRHGRPSRGDT
ncbi:MAG TPA: class I SAM-dependent methyltransferase [Acidimicrobiales bacterium]|nr:class I SAM-dependent methyltransferase [Acidimicrobiales bacterium]